MSIEKLLPVPHEILGQLDASLLTEPLMHLSWKALITTHLMILLLTNLKSSCDQETSLVERVGAGEAGELRSTIATEVSSGKSTPVVTRFLKIVAIIVGVRRAREGGSINPLDGSD